MNFFFLLLNGTVRIEILEERRTLNSYIPGILSRSCLYLSACAAYNERGDPKYLELDSTHPTDKRKRRKRVNNCVLEHNL